MADGGVVMATATSTVERWRLSSMNYHKHLFVTLTHYCNELRLKAIISG